MSNPTFSTDEILADVGAAFAARSPAARQFAAQWATNGLRFNKRYIAHIASRPTVREFTTTYAVTADDAKDLHDDVEITVSQRWGAPISMDTLDLISDDKVQYDQVVREAGEALAKAFIDDLLKEAKQSRFSYVTTETAANSDADVLNLITTALNEQGAGTAGRVGIVNSAVAAALNGDQRITSADYAAQLQGADGLRIFRNTHGFSLIQEYAGMSANNSVSLTGVTCANTGDLFTKAAHGLETGDRVAAASFSAGFSNGTYWVIRSSADTFQLASSLANAIAGTAVAVTADGTGGTISGAENISGFFTDGRGIQFLAGPEDHVRKDQIMEQLGIEKIISHSAIVVPGTGITMGSVAYQSAGTGNLFWSPLLLWGKVAGRKAGANAVGSFYDKAGHLLRTA